GNESPEAAGGSTDVWPFGIAAIRRPFAVLTGRMSAGWGMFNLPPRNRAVARQFEGIHRFYGHATASPSATGQTGQCRCPRQGAGPIVALPPAFPEQIRAEAARICCEVLHADASGTTCEVRAGNPAQASLRRHAAAAARRPRRAAPG